jgi:hypothetical protein
VYNIQFSAQLDNSDNQDHDADIWLALNGTTVANSNTQVTVPSSHGGTNGNAVAAWNFVLTLAAGDYVELMWAVQNLSITLPTYAASAPQPGTPSLIVTVAQIAILGGTYQPADATLTALAGVSTAANKLPYFTGTDTATVTDITTAGREILSTASSGTSGQVLTSSGGGTPTWTTVASAGSTYSADSWDFEWTSSAGSPATISNYTGSANISAVSIVGAGSFGGSAVTYEGVSCWEFTPTSASAQQELNITPVTPVDEWELRARVWMPGEDSTGTPQHFGAIGKQVGTNKPQFMAGASVTGLCRQNGTTEEVKIEGADIRQSWVTITIKATRIHTGATLSTWNQLQFQLWCGEFLSGTWNGSNVTAASLAPGLIRFGKSTGTGTRVMRIASLQWRSGNNSAPPSWTFRGRGFGGAGPA